MSTQNTEVHLNFQRKKDNLQNLKVLNDKHSQQDNLPKKKKKKSTKDSQSKTKQRKHKKTREKSNSNNEEVSEIERTQEELSIAIIEQNKDTIPNHIEKLKSIGGNLSFRDKEDGLTLLHRSIIQGSFEITKILIEAGIEVNVPNLNGLSPLHLASQMGDSDTVSFLILKSANVMQKDFENRISLHHAVLGGNVEVGERLLATKNILINHRDNHGYSALHLAAKHESKPFVVLLIEHGADPVLIDNYGNRPIDLVPGFSRFGSKELQLSHNGKKTVKALKKRGGNKVKKINSEALRNNITCGSRSFDHRSPNMITNHENVLQIAPSVPSLATGDKRLRKNNNLMTENDLQLLYYTPRDHPEQNAQNNNNNNNNNNGNNNNNIHNENEDHKKTDRYGFYLDEANNSTEDTNKDQSSKSLKEEKKALKWLHIIKNWESKKHSRKILKYCDKGIPDSVRGIVWKLLAGFDEEDARIEIEYSKLLEGHSTPEVKEQIHKDIHRTMPNHILFEEKGQGRQMLTNVLTAYAVYKPEIGYCQGMGFITAMFLMFMPEEVSFLFFIFFSLIYFIFIYLFYY